jgi:hypothetical protein
MDFGVKKLEKKQFLFCFVNFPFWVLEILKENRPSKEKKIIKK